MDTSILSLVDLFIAFVGVYLIYSGIVMRVKGEINESLLWNKHAEKKYCRDKEGFIRFFFPHMVGVGLIVLADGVISYLGDRVQEFRFLQNFTLIVTLIAVIWYALAAKKGVHDYFE